MTISEIAVGIAVAMIPFVAVGGLLWLSGRMRRRESVRIIRQIAVTDAIHRELGAAAAPAVRRDWLGNWTVSVAVPFEQKGTVDGIVRIAWEFFAKCHPADVSRLRIVLTPEERKAARSTGPSLPGLGTGSLRRVA